VPILVLFKIKWRLIAAILKLFEFTLFFCVFSRNGNDCSKRYKTEDIWNNHKVIEHICKFPYEVYFIYARAEENEADRDYRENNRRDFIVFKEILNIYFSKEVPADNCGESEEHRQMAIRILPAPAPKCSPTASCIALAPETSVLFIAKPEISEPFS